MYQERIPLALISIMTRTDMKQKITFFPDFQTFRFLECNRKLEELKEGHVCEHYYFRSAALHIALCLRSRVTDSCLEIILEICRAMADADALLDLRKLEMYLPDPCVLIG